MCSSPLLRELNRLDASPSDPLLISRALSKRANYKSLADSSDDVEKEKPTTSSSADKPSDSAGGSVSAGADESKEKKSKTGAKKKKKKPPAPPVPLWDRFLASFSNICSPYSIMIMLSTFICTALAYYGSSNMYVLDNPLWKWTALFLFTVIL